MARLARKDTFMYEVAGPEILVRRQVFAGQFVPDSFVEGEDTDAGAFEEAEGPPTFGLGAAPNSYQHQMGVDTSEQVRRTHGEDVSDEDASALAVGGEAARQAMGRQGKRQGNAEQEDLTRAEKRSRAAHRHVEEQQGQAAEDNE